MATSISNVRYVFLFHVISRLFFAQRAARHVSGTPPAARYIYMYVSLRMRAVGKISDIFEIEASGRKERKTPLLTSRNNHNYSRCCVKVAHIEITAGIWTMMMNQIA